MSPDPIEDLASVDQPLAQGAVDELMDMAKTLPARIVGKTIRTDLQAMPTFDMAGVAEVTDYRITERLFQMYSHFANAFVWCEEKDPRNFVPAPVAVPLVQLANMLERPPMLPYASTALANFKRVDPNGGYGVDNLRCIQKMVDIEDETWFHIIHVEIESQAGAAIFALIEASRLAQISDQTGVERQLAKVPPAFDEMIRTFRRIAEKCSTEIYYYALRPYLFGFDDVVYEGVEEFGGKPMSFRGESGAQSTVIPAIRSLLGLVHAQGGLSKDLEAMTAYMPKPHRELLMAIDGTAIRGFVMDTDDPNLRDLYNLCLERMVDFRSLHLKMAHAFIAQKVKDPRGTGGTDFMKWLTILRDETAKQLIPS
jgi:indoleamine 2,3-dioxygenase